MKPSRRRKLRPEEAELWARVIEAAAPMHPVRRKPKPEPEAQPEATPEPGPEPWLRPFSVRGAQTPPGVTLNLAPTLSERLSEMHNQMDRKKFGKLRKGKLAPEGRIDLHGMTQAEAHPALAGFILQSYAMGRRLVLVITGKGKPGENNWPMPVRQGVLRHQVPHWLGLPPLRDLVLQISEAHVTHGGGGAFYVYLRRNRET
jgi:DNA-nicking Smr family endonuclease